MLEMSSTLIYVGLPEDSKSSITKVPNAPKSCIGEIFSSDVADGSPMKNGVARPRVIRDTPTRPRDTHSRLFGQAGNNSVSPMMTDTIRSHIQFGDAETNGSPNHSPVKMNGSASSTPSRASYTPPKRNPVTGDGVAVAPPRRRHPAASLRGAHLNLHHPEHTEEDLLNLSHSDFQQPEHTDQNLLNPQPTHRYFTKDWPPRPTDYYVQSTTKPALNISQTPYTLLGLKSDDPEKPHPIIDPDSLSPPLVLDRHWPPFPAQHYLEPSEHKMVYHPLPPYAFVGLASRLGDRPKLDYKYDPVPTLDGPINPFLVAHSVPPPTLFKYERDGPIPDVTPLQTPLGPGPHTLTGFPPIFHKYVPGYLFKLNRHAEDFRPKTCYVDYVRRREMEGNPITGDGYKSLNGQINTVTSINGTSNMIHHSRVPPGGYSSGLW